MMEATSPKLSATLLVAAGLYQVTPLKRACLSSCSTPVAFLIPRWREGPAGAFRLGVEHGLFCLGCCWALMLLLFAGGLYRIDWADVGRRDVTIITLATIAATAVVWLAAWWMPMVRVPQPAQHRIA